MGKEPSWECILAKQKVKEFWLRSSAKVRKTTECCIGVTATWFSMGRNLIYKLQPLLIYYMSTYLLVDVVGQALVVSVSESE